MQSLQIEIVAPVSSQRCARELLASVPAVMRFMREQMRGHRGALLSVPQFRALVFASHSEDASLSALAEHIGLSLPATSRMVDVLVKRGLLQRQAGCHDRRRVALSLTGRGRATFRAARKATQAALARRFDALSEPEQALVSQALGILSRAFAPENCRAEAVK
jgi:DNA-binding MarR family transcriptional regulator